MSLIENAISRFLQQFDDIFLEPVAIDRHLLNLFCSFVSCLNVDKPNIRLLRKTRHSLQNLQKGNSASAIFRTNITRCLDVLLRIFQANDNAIMRLKKRSRHKILKMKADYASLRTESENTIARLKTDSASQKTESENAIARMVNEIERLKTRKPVVCVQPTVIEFTLSR